MSYPINKKMTFHSDNPYLEVVSGTTVMFTGKIIAPSANAANVYVEGNDGSDVPFAPGSYSPDYIDVDLSLIKLKGTTADCVYIIGFGTWDKNYENSHPAMWDN